MRKEDVERPGSLEKPKFKAEQRNQVKRALQKFTWGHSFIGHRLDFGETLQ